MSTLATRQFYPTCFLIMSLSLLCGCGDDDENERPLLQGRFIDRAVQGLTYPSDETSGVTDENGTFTYYEGDIVSFSIGDWVIGVSAGDDIITPVSFEDDGELDNYSINLSRILQSIDEDGDLSNGINVSETVATIAGTITIDMTVDPSLFTQDNIQALLDAVPDGRGYLVSEAEATSHLIESFEQEGLTLTVSDDDSTSDGDDSSGDGSSGDDSDGSGDDDSGDDSDGSGDDSSGDDSDGSGDDNSGDGSDGSGDDSSGDDSDGAGGNGSDVDSSAILTVTGEHSYLVGGTLEVNDIAFGFAAFSGVEHSVTLVGMEDLNDVEDLLAGIQPDNGFVIVVGFIDGIGLSASLLTLSVDGVEYNYECSVNCEITVNVPDKLVTFSGAVFIWDDGTETMELTGSVDWTDDDEYISSDGLTGNAVPSESELCDPTTSITQIALEDAGLSYEAAAGECFGLQNVEMNKAELPLTAIYSSSGNIVSNHISVSPTIKLAAVPRQNMVWGDEDDNDFYDTEVYGVYEITNTGNFMLCDADRPDWHMTDANGEAITFATSLEVRGTDNGYFDTASLYSQTPVGARCLPPGATRKIHVNLMTFADVDDGFDFSVVSEVTVIDSFVLESPPVSFVYLTPDYAEWDYEDSVVLMRVAMSNATGSDLILDDSAQRIMYYDVDGYYVSDDFIYVHEQLGLEKYDLDEDDLTLLNGNQIILKTGSAGIGYLPLAPATAAKAVFYPEFK